MGTAGTQPERTAHGSPVSQVQEWDRRYQGLPEAGGLQVVDAAPGLTHHSQDASRRVGRDGQAGEQRNHPAEPRRHPSGGLGAWPQSPAGSPCCPWPGSPGSRPPQAPLRSQTGHLGRGLWSSPHTGSGWGRCRGPGLRSQHRARQGGWGPQQQALAAHASLNKGGTGAHREHPRDLPATLCRRHE